MNNLKKQNQDQLRRRRNLMLVASSYSDNEQDQKAFDKATEGLEKRMYRKVRIAVIAVSLLVLFSIVSSGCVSNTIDGFRRDINHWTADPAHHK